MVSEVPSQPVVETDGPVVPSISSSLCRNCPGKKNKVKVPKKIHKAEREKLKREHLNDLFLDLANALELTEPNNGKAAILCEASRLLKDLFAQIECLRKEQTSLLSESRYVNIEKNELREETSDLASQIEKLQSELQSRAVRSKPDLNIPPPAEFLEQETTISNFSGQCLGLPVMEPTVQQTHAVFIIPVRPDLPSYPATDAAHAPTMPTSHVSKPHPRYPMPADSWPAGLLKLSQTNEAGKEVLGIGCKSIADMGERGSDRSES
ncbi:transcription factor bHLH47-like isoform X1 [Cucurbita maxima]|uniref:Transcription factor bHLH47-like isoform X1 n=1 Tax=Cucurbita maxima TaxID=3661 RepID=A0A6J1JDG7_CUCMA|nr:transcription factor bHLH47-like isoform X1 [Cucurbita maxima]